MLVRIFSHPSHPLQAHPQEFIKQSAETRFLRLWGWEEIEDCRSKVHPHIPRLLAWLLFNLFYGEIISLRS
jgi:hypothetical protein